MISHLVGVKYEPDLRNRSKSEPRMQLFGQRKIVNRNKTKLIRVSLFDQLLATKGQKLTFIKNPTCAKHCYFPFRISSSLGSSPNRLLIKTVAAQERFSILPKVT